MNDHDFSLSARPELRVSRSVDGWFWYAKVPGVLAHSPHLADGPLWPTVEEAIAEGLRHYPGAVVKPGGIEEARESGLAGPEPQSGEAEAYEIIDGSLRIDGLAIDEIRAAVDFARLHGWEYTP